MLKAHRVSWQLFRSEIPAGLHVLHHCDNRRCVNPAHLFLGTHHDNMRDKVAKGRQSTGRGNQQPRAKLTPEKVRAICRYNRPQRHIAAEYGVSQRLVTLVKQRKIWAHVDVVDH